MGEIFVHIMADVLCLVTDFDLLGLVRGGTGPPLKAPVRASNISMRLPQRGKSYIEVLVCALVFI